MAQRDEPTEGPSSKSHAERLAAADTVVPKRELQRLIEVNEEKERRKGGMPIAAVPGSVLSGFAAASSSTSWLFVAGSVGIALLAHLVLLKSGANYKPKVQQRIVMEIVKPPPPPPPKKEEPPEPEAKPEPKPEPKPKKKLPPPPKDEPPPPPPSNSEPEEVPQEPVPVVVGASIDSVVKSSASGMKVPTGNTTYGKVDPNADRSNVKKYAGGVAGGTAKEAFKPIRKSQLSTGVGIAKKHTAKYPNRLREEGVEGQVLCRVGVGSDGRTKWVKILKSVHPTLDKLAKQSLMLFRWKPATKDGTKVDTVLTYRYNFSLDQ